MTAIISTQTHDHLVKYLSTATGRDRIHRFVQYFSRFLVWHGQRNGYDKDLLARLTNLMGALGQTRKLMRVGRQVEFLRTIQKAAGLKDDVTRLTTIVKNTFLSLWLAHDTCQWAHGAGVVKFTNITEISRRGMKCWLIALTASILGNLHKSRVMELRYAHEEKIVRAAKNKGVPDEVATQTLETLRRDKVKQNLATFQDALDICIPATGLGLLNIESGYIGLIGATTSILGAITQWNNTR